MLISSQRAYSLPNLAELPQRFPGHGYADMTARLSDARPVELSVSMRNIHHSELPEKPYKIKNNLQAYTLLKYEFYDVKPVERIIPHFHLLCDDDKMKYFVISLRKINNELKEILSACDIFREDNLYIFSHEDWLESPIHMNLHPNISCAEKISYHLLLHGLHFGDISSDQDLR